MSIVSAEEVKNSAQLARMSVTDLEADAAAANLSGILENFETIRSIDTNNISAADDVSGLRNVMREDSAHDGILATPELLLQKAKTHNGYVEVPAVFGEQSVP